jgi:hypothetical protein
MQSELAGNNQFAIPMNSRRISANGHTVTNRLNFRVICPGEFILGK